MSTGFFFFFNVHIASSGKGMNNEGTVQFAVRILYRNIEILYPKAE